MSNPERKFVEVEVLRLPEFRNDHGPACTCMQCVLARGEKRRVVAEKIAAERAAKRWMA